MALADRIRTAREAAGFDTQTKFAKKIGVERAAVSQWESLTNPTVPRPEHLQRISELTGRSFDWLLSGEASVQLVPLIDWVSAGRLVEPMSQIPIEDVPLLAFADLGSGDWFALTVNGDSMDRLSPEGSTIIVNHADRELLTGRKYVFSIRGEATYKEWDPDPVPQLVPVTTNPAAHKTFFPKTEEEVVVVGRVRRTLLDL